MNTTVQAKMNLNSGFVVPTTNAAPNLGIGNSQKELMNENNNPLGVP